MKAVVAYCGDNDSGTGLFGEVAVGITAQCMQPILEGHIASIEHGDTHEASSAFVSW